MHGWDRLRTRRSLFGLAAGASAAVVAGCGGGTERSPLGAAIDGARSNDGANLAPATGTPAMPPTPTPTATPTPRPRGESRRTLLAGTPSETEFVVRDSGADGPVLFVLGGVHGNEPGGWAAADDVATWEPAAGSLIVLPRANVQAIADFIRTTDAIGDLNRLYPGRDDSELLMERMAAEIVGVAREYAVDVLLDMHESWAFFAGRAQDGTAFLGQTVTAGNGPRNPSLTRTLVERTNAEIAVERDLLIVRDGSPFGNPNSMRGRSSLAIGSYVPGLTPILVEMGQEAQAEARRTELHLLTARALMGELGML